MSTAVVRCIDVSFAYGRRQALTQVTLGLNPGLTGLLGPNGAGKSTLMGLIATLTVPTQGTVKVFGQDSRQRGSRRAIRRRIGVLPQRFALVSTMTVRDTVAYAAWANGVASSECHAAADRALTEVGLTDNSRQRVRTLSGGQRQRVGIAAALAHEPDLLILDEPTVGLDPLMRVQLRRTLSALGAKRTVLLSTHLVEDVVHLCPQVAVLDSGRIAYQGPADRLASLADGRDDLASPLEVAYERLLGGSGPAGATG